MKVNYWVKKSKFKYSQKQLYLLRGFTKSNFVINNQRLLAIKTYSSLFLKSNQIEAGRRLVRHFFKKQCRVLINLKFNKAITKKSNGTRMGKGKGNFEDRILAIKSGLIIYNFLFVNNFQFFFLNSKLKSKLSFIVKPSLLNSMGYYSPFVKYLY